MAANPLLLRVLALIHRTGARLPQKRIELYRLAADTLARTWRTAMGVPESALVEEQYLTRLLGRLAYWLHVNKPTGLATEREVYEQLGKAWVDVKKLDREHDDPDVESEVARFLHAVRVHTGLFVERAPKRYGFMHLTFEEYYAARHLVARSKSRAELIRTHLHDPRWDEPILLALGFVGLDSPDDASDLIKAAVLAKGEDAEDNNFVTSPHEGLLGRDFLFALRCLADDIPADPQLTRRLCQRLVQELTQNSDSAKYRRYKQALNERLAGLHDSKAAQVVAGLLVEASRHADADVRLQAVQCLVQVGQAAPEVVVPVLVAALRDDDADVRLQAARSLGQLGQVSPELIDLAVEGLPRVENWSTRRNLAQLLGVAGRGEQRIVDVLYQGLLDADNDVRTACATSLAQIGRRVPATAPGIETKLVQALRDPMFEKRDEELFSNRTGHDYAFDALWMLVAGDTAGE